MTEPDLVAGLFAALELPVGARVDQRVPKKLLLENGAPTAADKRAINDGVEELFWLAALKPTTIGVAEYRDATRDYVEIAVLRLRLREGAKRTRLVELVHRAIPYPVLLFVEQADGIAISAAHKRWSLGETGETVLDGEEITAECGRAFAWPGFPCALALGRQPGTQLHALYQGWIDVLVALNAANLTGVFVVATSPKQSADRREALREHARLTEEIAGLRAAAEKETQVSRHVEINLEIKALSARLKSIYERIGSDLPT